MIESPSGRLPEKAQDGISWEQRLAAAEKYYRGSLWYWGNIPEFIGEELGLKELRGAHKPGGRPPRGAPRWLVAHPWVFWPLLQVS